MAEQMVGVGGYIAIPITLGIGYMLYEKSKKKDSVEGLVEGTTPGAPSDVPPGLNYHENL